VQQQDLHVETTTVREALRFSAMLRQSSNISKQEKFAYVEKVIEMLGMTDFADAVVGVPGHGLSTRQRKLLSIGVELAAKPSILLFLDEPTTGLDSASAFGVISFLRILANSGTTILCTIHQPSAVLFQQFDRLLLLVDGGRTAYFGNIGGNSQTVIQHFERNGARACSPGENPAEYIIETASHSSMDWADVWKTSQEGQAVTAEVDHLSKANEMIANQQTGSMKSLQEQPQRSQQFALPFHQQLYHVTARVFQQYWRTPKYVWAKMLLAFVSSM
jgi:ABC-type multidrug transport system ATPase subunit